jgi:adenosylcobinamide-phosphate synthase
MDIEMNIGYIIIIAFILDLIAGDPRWLPHPVIYIGKIISFGEKAARKIINSPNGLKIAGTILAVGVVLATYFFFWGVLWLAYELNNYVGMVLSIFFMYQALAVNSLYKHALAVAQPLSKGDLPKARNSLAMIVGRDTENLNENDISRGVVETVSENTVDGITAPLFYAFLGGVPLAMAYKAINTLDSMIGYKDERYINFGCAGARLDDIANYIPARITGILYLLIAPFTPGGFNGVFRAIREDAPKHPSPNSGIPEAAVAGALQVQLGGLNYYRGVASHRALMGKAIKHLEFKHIYHSIYIMFAVSALMLILGLIYLHFIQMFCR